MRPRSILFLICFTTRQLLTERSCQLDMETEYNGIVSVGCEPISC